MKARAISKVRMRFEGESDSESGDLVAMENLVIRSIGTEYRVE